MTAVNDAPVLDLNGPATNGTSFDALFTEGGGPVSIVGGTATVFDIDSNNMLSATVQIAAPLDGIAETLAATGSGGITVGPYNTATGRIVLTGSATKGQYETVLRTVTYNNTSDNPNTTARTINFQVFDNATTPLGSNAGRGHSQRDGRE